MSGPMPDPTLRRSDRPLEGSLVLGRYRILQALARGGMGMVYLGRIEGAAGFSKPVVVKRVLSHLEDDDGDKSRQQFIREARILSNLNHPGIVGVIDFAEEDDSYLMVLEYVHGYQLGHWLRYIRGTRREMPWELAVLIVIRVLQALHHAHTFRNSDGKVQEIIHRDISPGNILIDLDGNVRLLDFGIARSKGDTGEYKTEEGVLKGKLPYIAPEMYHQAEATVSSDVYACAVVLYQLLAGKNPFVGKGMSDTVNRVLKLNPDPISIARPEVPFDLDDVLERALKKEPQYRFQSAQELSQALYQLLRRPEAALGQKLREHVQRDFTGDMPEKLKVHRLDALEHAWRAASGDDAPNSSLLRASTPPPPAPDPADDESHKATREVARAELPTATISTEVAESLRAAARAEVERRPGGMSSRTLVISIVAAALLAAGVAVGAVLALTGNEKPTKQRFLVVDRTSSEGVGSEGVGSDRPGSEGVGSEGVGSEGVGSEGVGSDGVQPAASHLDGADPPGAGPGEATNASPTSGDPSGLTSAFARRRGQIQACFDRYATELEGTPQVTVRFQLTTSGAVKTATISPNALAGTDVGRCILDVARSTEFGPQERPVAFSIPIQVTHR